ncbi:MAG: type II toxin-antitoxin system VapC family toxin [Syntrophobacteraceae bacterium]|jgi:tRNA(fMet)-specific endonuclease VapC
MLFMLDTNICIYTIKNRPAEVIQKVKEFSPSDLVISAITVCELEYGASKSTNPEKNRQTLVKFLAPFEICPFNEQAASHYGDIRAHLERSGNLIGAMDLLIAAHARSLSLTLVTNNLNEFQRVPGLSTVNWT